MSWLHLEEEGDSRETQYGDLDLMLPRIHYWTDEIVQGESMPLYKSTDLLLRNKDFSSPDDVAELVISNQIKILPKASYLITTYRIIPVQLIESGQYFLLYSPDDWEGQLHDVKNHGWDLSNQFSHIIPGVGLEEFDLVVCTHSHFRDIRSFISDTQQASKYISAFNDGSERAISELVEWILAALRKKDASDFHVQPMVGFAYLKMRLHGLLQPVPGSVKKVSLEVGRKIAQVLAQNTGWGLKPGTTYGGSFRYVAPGKVWVWDEWSGKLIPTENRALQDTDYRLSIAPARGGSDYSTVVRLLRKSWTLKTLEALDYDDPEIFLRATKIGTGITIMSGPTGSGKSTTLYAMLSAANDPSLSVKTIEDPIEITLDGIVQTQVNEKTGYTMSSALREILRQDPDRIMVGEIRDSETAKLATDASNTGHAVITTLHANSAADCVRRLMRLGIDAVDIASTIKYLFAQRLVERLDESGSFVEQYDATEELTELFGQQIEWPVWLRRPLQGEGVVGRIPVYECIPMTANIIDAIETYGERISSTKIEDIALQEWLVPMEIYGLRKVLEWKTSLKSLTRYIDAWRMRRFRDIAIPLIQQMVAAQRLAA